MPIPLEHQTPTPKVCYIVQFSVPVAHDMMHLLLSTRLVI